MQWWQWLVLAVLALVLVVSVANIVRILMSVKRAPVQRGPVAHDAAAHGATGRGVSASDDTPFARPTLSEDGETDVSDAEHAIEGDRAIIDGSGAAPRNAAN